MSTELTLLHRLPCLPIHPGKKLPVMVPPKPERYSGFGNISSLLSHLFLPKKESALQKQICVCY